jgi:tungstate transport system substrate-binding protein
MLRAGIRRKHRTCWWLTWGVAFGGLLVAGCQSRGDARGYLTLATTTSTRDSGLLDMLLSEFTQQSGIHVRVIAVGSGQALELGRRGDADVLLTHSPTAERHFMREGYGETRDHVMDNRYVLVGPVDDPANVAGGTSIRLAFSKVMENRALFVSRGDESGTHHKELEIWRTLGAEPKGDWYLGAGVGMVGSLRIANERQAYCLADRATWLAHRARLELRVVVENDPVLVNPYTVIRVSEKKHRHARRQEAREFVDFLLSPTTQAMIAQFGRVKFGESLFFARSTSGNETQGP